ncbi:MAG TPA: protein-glutamate O-methyltransferase CheR [Enterovirga sp.]
MMDADFAFLRGFLKSRSGLDLGLEKRYLAESRLQPLCRATGLSGLGAVVQALKLGSEDLARAVVGAMATHETLFFRDRAPFDALRDKILPCLDAARPPGRPLRIWSAAASTGQEAYSVAMLVREMGPALNGRPVEILATDLSAEAIARARAGTYTQFEIQRGLPIRALLLHFGQKGDRWEILPELRRAVEFRVFNLMEDFTSLGSFDVILCRNLLIYLDLDAKEKLLGKLSRSLAEDGALALGAAETTLGLSRTLVPHPEMRGFFVHGTVPAGAPMRSDPSALSVLAPAGG